MDVLNIRDKPEHLIGNRIGLIMPPIVKISLSESVEFVNVINQNIELFDNSVKTSVEKTQQFLHSVSFANHHFDHSVSSANHHFDFKHI